MIKIEKEDLISGEIYVGTNIGNDVLFMPGKDLNGFDDACLISSDGRTFRKNTSCNTASGTTFREATPEEKAWLKACIKADKFVKRDSIKLETVINDYQLY